MNDLHATAIRIATRQPVTLRGLTMRIPAARQDADQAVAELLRSGRLAVNADGTIGLPTVTAKPKRAKYSKRADGITRAAIMAYIAATPATSRQIAAAVEITQTCTQRHMKRLIRDGLVIVVGYQKRTGRCGVPFRLYGLPRVDYE